MKSSRVFPHPLVFVHLTESYLQYRAKFFGLLDKNMSDVQDSTHRLKLKIIEGLINKLLQVKTVEDWRDLAFALKKIEEEERKSRYKISYLFEAVGVSEPLRLADTLQAMRSYINHSLKDHDEYLRDVSESDQNSVFADRNFYLLHYTTFIRSLGGKPGVGDGFISYLTDTFEEFSERVTSRPMQNSYCEQLVAGCMQKHVSFDETSKPAPSKSRPLPKEAAVEETNYDVRFLSKKQQRKLKQRAAQPPASAPSRCK